MRQTILVLAAFLSVSPAFCRDTGKPLLVILTDTKEVRDGLPVLSPHPENARISRELSRGFLATTLRLYRSVQAYLDPETVPEPAYLLFSSNQGGFPRFGFYLNHEKKPNTGYVDLYGRKRLRLAGHFGDPDQIFPHELGHIIMRLLASAPESGGSNQMHAIAVRTDPQTAYQEGFAEHLQVMSIDDPDADPATRALASDLGNVGWAQRNLEQYSRELQATWSFATPKRMSFLFWFSGTEQVLRYWAVKNNEFAYAPVIPGRMLENTDPYRAYLLTSIMPGRPGSGAKPAGVMLSTEGVVSSLFFRWFTNNAIRGRYLDADFYRRFGVARQDVTPLENAYLKLFHAIRTHRPQNAADAVRAYKAVYPEESSDVDAVVSQVLLGQPLAQARCLWLANSHFKTGTSLFDQYRSAPRTHTFDLNAASRLDLMGVPGMDSRTADTVLRSGPYSSVDDLGRVTGLNRKLLDQFREMEADMRRLGDEPGEGVVSMLPRLLRSYAWRALVALLAAAVPGAILFRRIRRKGWFRSAVSALGVSFLVLALSWIISGCEGLLGYVIAVSVFALPSAVSLAVRKRWAQALPAIAAWAAAGLPAKLMIYPF